MTTIHSVTNISKETTEKELKLFENAPPFVLPNPHSLPKIENLLNSVEDSAPQVKKQFPTTDAILNGLKVLKTHIDRKKFQLIADNPTLFSVKSLGLAIELLENEEPLPETAVLIKDLKELLTWAENDELYKAPPKTLELVLQTIKFLEKGEPFNPEPHPDSGQGKWKETAAFHSRNEDFYRGIINQIGEILGVEAYTADDGSVGDSVLALKVPELVKKLKEQNEKLNQYNGN